MNILERVRQPELAMTALERRRVALAGAVAFGVPLTVAAMLAVSPVAALALAVLIVAVALAWRSIIYPVALAGLPSLFVAIYGSNPLPTGAVFIATSLWVVLGVIFAIVRGTWPREASKLAVPPILLSVLLSALLIVRMTPLPYATTKLELFLSQNMPLLLAGIVIASRREIFRRYVLLALGLAIANALVLTNQLSSGQAQAVYYARFTISVSFDPLQAGRLAAEGVLYATVLILAARDSRSRLFGFVSLPFLAVALFASGSRGPTLALVMAFLTFVALVLRERQARIRLLVVATGAVAGLVAAAALVPGDALSRSTSFLFGNSSDLSSNGRAQVWQEALHVIATHPVFGVGTGGFSLYNPVERYPHNILLEAAAELGIFGLLLVATLLVVSVKTAFVAWLRTTSMRQRIDAALVSGLLVAAITNHMLSDGIESTGGLWLAVGLVYGFRVRLQREPAAEAEASAQPTPVGSGPS